MPKTISLPETVQPVLEVAVKAIEEEIQSVQALSEVASKYPYYKYNGLWSKDVQNVTSHILLCAWLGGLNVQGKENKEGTLLTIEDVGSIMGGKLSVRFQTSMLSALADLSTVPVSSQTDQFHLTLDEYLHSLLSLIEELSRLATNSVTLGDFQRPLQIAKFIGELHAGFQMLNLKNDSLRRRSDGVKYQVKSVEGVVYDLSLRGLVKKGGEQ